jgi:hypothetical protein
MTFDRSRQRGPGQPDPAQQEQDDERIGPFANLRQLTMYRRIQRKKADAAKAEKDDAAEAQVSQPNEPAEQEADKVADHVVDEMHGEGKEGEHDKQGEGEHAKDGDRKGGEAGKEKAPAIGAKLQPGIIATKKGDANKGDGKKGTPGPSGKASTDKYLENNWDKATFGQVKKSVEYHVGKHGKGLSPVEYTQAALKAFEDPKAKKVKATDVQGRPALKVSSEQYGNGLFTPQGKVIWFHPK